MSTTNKKRYQSEAARHRDVIRKMWIHMYDRCANSPSYLRKNIQVCTEWQSFKPFLDWAESQNFQHDCGLELDRIDNDGDYSPDNCRFVDKLTNLQNREAYRPYQILANHEEWFPSLRSAAKSLGISYTTLHRYVENGRTYKGRSFMKLEYDILDLTPKSSQV